MDILNTRFWTPPKKNRESSKQRPDVQIQGAHCHNLGWGGPVLADAFDSFDARVGRFRWTPDLACAVATSIGANSFPKAGRGPKSRTRVWLDPPFCPWLMYPRMPTGSEVDSPPLGIAGVSRAYPGFHFLSKPKIDFTQTHFRCLLGESTSPGLLKWPPVLFNAPRHAAREGPRSEKATDRAPDVEAPFEFTRELHAAGRKRSPANASSGGVWF